MQFLFKTAQCLHEGTDGRNGTKGENEKCLRDSENLTAQKK